MPHRPRRLDDHLSHLGYEGLVFSTIIEDPERFTAAGMYTFSDGAVHYHFVERTHHTPSRAVDLFVEEGLGFPVLREAHLTMRDAFLGERTVGTRNKIDGSIVIVEQDRQQVIKKYYSFEQHTRQPSL